ncbi:MAG TPA: hypothetical protein VFV38_04240 [Ktedonobacteraceae bacterium]|nr:hypothetical protein [Ktedonobacteraceae bacterium]
MAHKALFREQALQHYNQQHVPVVMPRFVSLRATILLWIVLAVCIGAACVSWLIPIPSYIAVSGIVQTRPGIGIVLFLPASQATGVRQGMAVQIQLGENGPHFATAVASVQTEVMSPASARQRYHLGDAAWGIVTEPSIALLVPLATTLSPITYAGSLVTAQVQSGTSSVFHLLPGLTGGTNG